MALDGSNGNGYQPQKQDAQDTRTGPPVSLDEPIPQEYVKEGGSVNHPPHYNGHPSGVECIDIIEAMPANIAMAMKYLWREGLKEGECSEKDLNKAIWYTKREIQYRKFRAGQIPVQEYYTFIRKFKSVVGEADG